MRGRILVLMALISLSAAASAHAQDEHRWACAFSVSAGRPVGLPGNDTMTPWLGVGFEYALTPRLALEATVTTIIRAGEMASWRSRGSAWRWSIASNRRHVVAPVDADDTRRAYFAITPDANRGAGR